MFFFFIGLGIVLMWMCGLHRGGFTRSDRYEQHFNQDDPRPGFDLAFEHDEMGIHGVHGGNDSFND